MSSDTPPKSSALRKSDQKVEALQGSVPGWMPNTQARSNAAGRSRPWASSGKKRVIAQTPTPADSPTRNPTRVAPRQKSSASRPGQHLDHGHEGGEADLHQPLPRREQPAEGVAERQHRDDERPPRPEQPGVEVSRAGEVGARQDQVVEAHRRQRQRVDDEHAARRGDGADEGQRHHQRVAAARASAEHVVVRVPVREAHRAAQSSGITATLSSSRKSGNAQAATRSARPSSDSVKAMWNCRGRRNAAANESRSRVNQGPLCTGPYARCERLGVRGEPAGQATEARRRHR